MTWADQMLADAAFIRRLSDSDWQEAPLAGAPRCYMDGRGLQDLDPSITVYQILYQSPERADKAMLRAGGDGVLMTRRSFGSLTVAIRLFIREADAARLAACADRILRWARGGWFTAYDRPNRRVRLAFDSFAHLPVPQDGTAMELKLSAPFPYWQDAVPQRLQLSGTDESDEVFAPGYAADALVSARIAANAAVTQMTLSAGSSRIALTGLSLAAGQTVSLGWTDDRHIFFIRNETTGAGLLSRRTADSSDELRLPAGRTGGIALWANGRVSADFEVRGLYL